MWIQRHQRSEVNLTFEKIAQAQELASKTMQELQIRLTGLCKLKHDGYMAKHSIPKQTEHHFKRTNKGCYCCREKHMLPYCCFRQEACYICGLKVHVIRASQNVHNGSRLNESQI